MLQPTFLQGSCLLLFPAILCAQTVIPQLDPKETPGARPYEMVWANRTEPAPPTLAFEQLNGWRVQVEGGAEATLHASRGQNLWNRPVAKLRYHGDGDKNGKLRILISLPEPVALPERADSVDMWLFGNRWDWENPPDTPPVRIVLHFRDANDKTREFEVDRVRWKEWWLMHKKLPTGLNPPVKLEKLEVTGGWQKDWREIFFDSIRFYREETAPLKFSARPKRNLTLFEGQPAGANIGPGKLPFPTTERTILPMHLGGSYRNDVKESGQSNYIFSYSGKDCTLEYNFRTGAAFGGIGVRLNGEKVGLILDGAKVVIPTASGSPSCTNASLKGKVLTAEYSDGTIVRWQIWQKSLVMDVINRSSTATELSFGQISEVKEPRAIWVPYLTYGGGAHPCVLLSRAGTNHVFTSIWLDWYRSNGSEPYARESATNSTAQINGGIRYNPRTDGQRNPIYERVFVTVSPIFEEVLPTVPNPVGLHAKEAVDRLWQESWGPENFEKEQARSRKLRAYGIEKLIQCNHEIAWRDGGESFTLRLKAAPGKGGDEALKKYVAHQRGLGWLEGLYSNYTDYAPVNEYWSPNGVQRLSDGNWRSAWPRCWAEKPLKAVEFDALLAPQIKAKYNPNSAYTDVQTAVAPWGYNDYDARVPGAGTFAQTFYAYGELLRNDSRVYGGPIFSEGSYHWLYAGLADGNYALAYDGRPLAKEPLLPVFDLYQIHTKECDIGMAWTGYFCEGIPNWNTPTNIDRAIDRFLLNTLAYGHIGWLIEESHGIERACRSYYMLQQVQKDYGLQAPTRIAYWDGAKLCTISEALIKDLPRTRRQLYVEYPSGLKLWLNDHPQEKWRVETGSEVVELPPAGWAARNKKLAASSALQDGKRMDYLRSPSYTFLDGRGNWVTCPEGRTKGSLAIRPLPANRLEIIKISGDETFVIRRAYGVKGGLAECEVYDVEGKRLANPKFENGFEEARIQPVPGGIKYILRFGAKE